MATPKKAPEDHLRRGRKPTGKVSRPIRGTTAPPEIAEAIDRAGGIRKVIQEWYTRKAYAAAIARIDQMRAELRDAIEANAEANVEGPLYVHDELDDLFAPEFTDGQLEAIFCDPFSECEDGIC